MDFNNFQSENKLNPKKLILVMISFIIFIIMYFIFHGRTLFDKTNNILLLLSLLSDSIFMTLLMGFIVISILPIIILRKTDEVSFTSKHMPIIVLIILIIYICF